MHSKEDVEKLAVERVLRELRSELEARMKKIETDARDFSRQPGVTSTLSQVTMIEATGAVDALQWAVDRVELLRADRGVQAGL